MGTTIYLIYRANKIRHKLHAIYGNISLYMTEPGKMGSNSPFTEIELAIVHESLRNAEKDATNRILISWFVIFWEFFVHLYPKKWYFEKIVVKVWVYAKRCKNMKKSVLRHLNGSIMLGS